jgi:uridylate kinase
MATELKTDIISPSTANQIDIKVAEEQMIVIDADGNVQVATAWNPTLSTTGKAFIMGF